MIDFNNAQIHITTAANKQYIQYLACLLFSIAEFGTVNENVHITVIHKGISQKIQNCLNLLLQNRIGLSWVEPTSVFLEEIKAPLEFIDCTPHYYRLLTPFLFKNQKRAVYLDADTLVLNNIAPLWKIDLEECSVAAVRDYLPTIKDAINNWRDLDLNPDAPYFNSGVLVIDISRWLAENTSQKVLNICGENQIHLRAQQKWNQYDQYGLNVLFNGKWKELDRVWNYGSELPPRDVGIVHFIGNGKIGLPKCQPIFSQIFFDLLNRASFKNWDLQLND